MPRTRFTEFIILVDTHYKPKTPLEEETLTQELLDAVKEFTSVPVLRRVLLCEDASKLRRKQLTGASVELGDRYGRIHVHFVLNLEHQTTVYLAHPDGRTVNRQFQDWFNERLGTNTFVSVSLGDTRAKNYATKGTKSPAAGVGRVSIDRGAVEAAQGGDGDVAAGGDRS